MSAYQKKVVAYKKLFERALKQNKKLSFVEQNHSIQACYEKCISALEKEKNTEKAQEKKAALDEAYDAFWVKRYSVLFEIYRWDRKEDELNRNKRDLLAEIHPDKNRDRNQEALSIRRSALDKAFKEIMRERNRGSAAAKDVYEEGLKQDAITKRQQALKQWFWDKAHDPQHYNNESIQVGASYLWGEEYLQARHAAQTKIVSLTHFTSQAEYTQAELAALAIVPYVPLSAIKPPHKILPLAARQQLLKMLEEEITDRFGLRKEHFINDQIPQLIWDNVFLQQKDFSVFFGGLYFCRYFTAYRAENLTTKLNEEVAEKQIIYPDLIKVHEWIKANYTCPLDRLAKKYPGDARFQLSNEAHFLLFLTATDNHYFRMEYEAKADYAGFTEQECSVLSAQKYEESTPSKSKFIDVKLINEFNLRELAWELIVREVNLYQTQPAHYPNKTWKQLDSQLGFIYQGIRLGGLSLKIIYDDLVKPLKELITQLNREIQKEKAEKAARGEHAPLLAQANSLKVKKRDQLVIVLNEVKKDIDQGIRDLVADPTRTHNDSSEQVHEDKKFVANLYKQLANKLEMYSKSAVIGRHQNVVGHMLMGVLGVISGVILTATFIGGVALLTSKEFFGSFTQTFFGTATQGALRTLRNKVNKASEYLRTNTAPKNSKTSYAYGFLPREYQHYDINQPKVQFKPQNDCGQQPEPPPNFSFEKENDSRTDIFSFSSKHKII